MYVYVCVYLFLILNVLIFQIFENGKDTGEISVCISEKDLGPNSPIQTGYMMERVSLLTIHLWLWAPSKLLVVNLDNYIFKVVQKRWIVCWSVKMYSFKLDSWIPEVLSFSIVLTPDLLLNSILIFIMLLFENLSTLDSGIDLLFTHWKEVTWFPVEGVFCV